MAHLVGSSKQLLKGLSLLALSGSAPLLTRATPASLVEAVTAEVGALIGTASEEQHGFQPPSVGGRGGKALFDRGGGTAGDFNLYVFAMSWKPEWCFHSEFPGCSAPRPFWKEHLTIHGLWPDYGDGTYPTTCTKEPYDHDRVVHAIGLETLETLWPNIQVAEDAGEKYDSFWEHEWAKHGTCSGLTQEEYFSATVSLLQDRFETPPQLTTNVGGETSRAELEEAYGGEGMAVLDCKGKVHLNQVFLCIEPDAETGFPGEQVPCPSAIVSHDDTCGPDSLDIASF